MEIKNIRPRSYYMKEALKEAKKAFATGEVPVGAVVVNGQGDIIARGRNETEKACTQAAHAECRALTRAGKRLKSWRLNDCWIYVTLEPCSMCMHLIKLSRLRGLIFGARSPLFGYHLDNEFGISVYKKDTFEIVEGVEAEGAADLLKCFFQQRRKKE